MHKDMLLSLEEKEKCWMLSVIMGEMRGFLSISLGLQQKDYLTSINNSSVTHFELFVIATSGFTDIYLINYICRPGISFHLLMQCVAILMHLRGILVFEHLVLLTIVS